MVDLYLTRIGPGRAIIGRKPSPFCDGAFAVRLGVGSVTNENDLARVAGAVDGNPVRE